MSFVVIRDPRLGGHNHPTVVHVPRGDAEAEAKRLAEGERGVAYFVCEFVAQALLPKQQAEIKRFGDGAEDPWDEDVPF